MNLLLARMLCEKHGLGGMRFCSSHIKPARLLLQPACRSAGLLWSRYWLSSGKRSTTWLDELHLEKASRGSLDGACNIDTVCQ
jgi:hypothetical protein